MLAQVHPGVERRHLIAVTVEHQSRSPEELAQPPFLGLAPTGVIDVGVDI